jgi:hypothetical protein
MLLGSNVHSGLVLITVPARAVPSVPGTVPTKSATKVLTFICSLNQAGPAGLKAGKVRAIQKFKVNPND